MTKLLVIERHSCNLLVVKLHSYRNGHTSSFHECVPDQGIKRVMTSQVHHRGPGQGCFCVGKDVIFLHCDRLPVLISPLYRCLRAAFPPEVSAAASRIATCNMVVTRRGVRDFSPTKPSADQASGAQVRVTGV